MNLHPAVAFGAALAGAALFGPMGAVLALPAAAVIQAFITTYLDRHDVIDSDLTKLEQIEEEKGDSALRKALRAHQSRRADRRPGRRAADGPSRP